jgi:hypothetical protein
MGRVMGQTANTIHLELMSANGLNHIFLRADSLDHN